MEPRHHHGCTLIFHCKQVCSELDQNLGIAVKGQLDVQLAFTLLAAAASCHKLQALSIGQDEASLMGGARCAMIDRETHVASSGPGGGQEALSLMLTGMQIQAPSVIGRVHAQSRRCATRSLCSHHIMQHTSLSSFLHLSCHSAHHWLSRPLSEPLLAQAAAEAEALSTLGHVLREEMGREGVLQPLVKAQAEMAAWLSA